MKIGERKWKSSIFGPIALLNQYEILILSYLILFFCLFLISNTFHYFTTLLHIN